MVHDPGLQPPDSEGGMTMSATIFNWIIVYEDGTTETARGATPEDALYNVDWSKQSGIISMVRNGWD